MRLILVALIAWPLALRSAEDVVLGGFEESSVAVELRLTGVAGDRAVIEARLTPKPQGQPLHLYGIDQAGGFPTRIELAPGDAARPAGDLTADQASVERVDAALGETLRTYPPGPVTVRLPIRLPPGAPGTRVRSSVLVTYMACTEDSCLPPVRKHAVAVELPAVAGAAAPAAGALDEAQVRALLAGQAETLRAAVREEAQRAAAEASEPTRIRWRHPRDRAEAEAMIAEAHAAGKAAFVDFTGPACNVCQRMAKTVLRLKPVVAAWNAQVPIEIDTDSHPDLAQWQQQRFATQNRPLYVRLDPAGGETRWSQPFATGDAATLERFLAFLAGRGAGADVASADGLGAFLALALLGGLFTLVMPCTYPMIPFTVNFFAKQAASGHRLAPLAAAYALGIIACFVGVGVVVTGVFGSTLSTFSGHPVTNLVIGLLFVVLGFSLLGAFLLRLPSGIENALGGGRGGYVGALVMGLTFAITAFACTAPFAGSVLAAAVTTGTGGAWARAVGGMAVYSSVIAVPFFFLALSPGLLKRLPRASGWMNEVKIVGGLIEVAAALKFLVICDWHWRWGVFGRTSVVAAWAALGWVITAYLFGAWRTSSDERVENVGVPRLLLGCAFLALALWLTAGLFGADLAVLESFFPE